MRKAQREYYERNTDLCKARAKAYYEQNKPLVKERSKTWQSSHKAEVEMSRQKRHAQDPLVRRFRTLKLRYGITREQYEKLLLSQDDKCALCLTVPTRQFHVDHDHTTGKVRGLLCSDCNTKLGILENKMFVDKATQYLRLHEESK